MEDLDAYLSRQPILGAFVDDSKVAREGHLRESRVFEPGAGEGCGQRADNDSLAAYLEPTQSPMSSHQAAKGDEGIRGSNDRDEADSGVPRPG